MQLMNGRNCTMLRWHDFEAYLSSRLCWIDSIPTHGGGGNQRQCPKCRKKWSFIRLEQQALLIRHFCALTTTERIPTPSYVARQTRLAYNTVHTHFRAFEQRLDTFIPEYVRNRAADFAPLTPEDYIYVKRISAARATTRHGAILRLYVLRQLPFEERCELVYRVSLLPELAPKIGAKVPQGFSPRGDIVPAPKEPTANAPKLRRRTSPEKTLAPLILEIRRWLGRGS